MKIFLFFDTVLVFIPNAEAKIQSFNYRKHNYLVFCRYRDNYGTDDICPFHMIRIRHDHATICRLYPAVHPLFIAP